jgi:hypothetical protein
MMNTLHTIPTHPQHMDDHLEPRQPALLPIEITNGELIGVPPSTFDGDRSKADEFITRFGLYSMINERNSVITNPKRRTALALTYIRGPKVDDWVSQQFNALSTKVNGDANLVPKYANTDEALWEDFVTSFKCAFSETVEEVLARLEDLQMTGDDVEMYIATFENLIRQARREREDSWMVERFCQGLPADFKRSIMRRETKPNTIDEWKSAAREQVERRIYRRRLMNHVNNRGPKGGDTDPVQTGVVRLSQLSEEKKATLMAEGQCFKCEGKGHLARNCPEENVRN